MKLTRLKMVFCALQHWYSRLRHGKTRHHALEQIGQILAEHPVPGSVMVAASAMSVPPKRATPFEEPKWLEELNTLDPVPEEPVFASPEEELMHSIEWVEGRC